MKLDPTKTAILTLDFQNGIFASATGSEVIVPTAAKVVEHGRKNGFRIIHVGLGFEEGYPEISERSYFAQRVKQGKVFIKGTPSAEFHAAIVRPGELIVHKHRISAFSENNLDLILRSQKIENLVLLGISTSGIVLSTIRRAFDLDYHCTVIQDACYDPDPEVHRVLTEKVFPRQGTVMTAEAFINE